MKDTNVPTLPPDVFASVVNALADTLIRDYPRTVEPWRSRAEHEAEPIRRGSFSDMAEDCRRSEADTMQRSDDSP